MPEPRWRSVSDFLSDLPRFHCSVKPPHSFCTVCLRINTSVAVDCPLRFEDIASAPGRASMTRAPAAPAPAMPYESESSYDSGQEDHVPAEAVLPDAPVIEFARSTEPHQPRRRMKARAVQKRAAGDTEGGEASPRPRPTNGRVWATHEAAGSDVPPREAEDPDARELREWNPDGGPNPTQRPRPPKSDKDENSL